VLRTIHVPIFADPQQGARINVWPSFYENQLRLNKREIRRKRIQLVHSGSAHVSLFVKNVQSEDFTRAASHLLEPGMAIGKGGSWQSVQVKVPIVDPRLGVKSQTDKLDQVFDAARQLYEFYLKHEITLLNIPTFK
jgi:hypothetical protein